MTKEKYTQLKDEFIQSLTYAHDRIDGRQLWPASGRRLRGSFVDLYALKMIRLLDSKSPEEIAAQVGSPFILRYLLSASFLGLKKAITDSRLDRRDAMKAIGKAFSALEIMCPADPFCLNGTNPTMNAEEIARIMDSRTWHQGERRVSEMAQTLNMLIYSYYFDFRIDNGLCIHGPYNLGDGRQLLVRDYFDLQPKTLWAEAELPKDQRICLYLVYKDAGITLDYLMHTESKKPLAPSLERYSIDAGNKTVTDPTRFMANRMATAERLAIKQVDFVDQLRVLKMIKKAAEISFYEFRGLTKDWAPEQEVYDCIAFIGLQQWDRDKAKSARGVTERWKAMFDLDNNCPFD